MPWGVMNWNALSGCGHARFSVSYALPCNLSTVIGFWGCILLLFSMSFCMCIEEVPSRVALTVAAADIRLMAKLMANRDRASIIWALMAVA